MVTKKKQYNRAKNFQAIPFTGQLALLTLATDVVLTGAIIGNFLRSFFGISVDCTWALRGGTNTEGPIQVGFAHSDLSVSEVAEALSAEVVDPSDIIARERSRRPVRRSGVFPGISTQGVLNDGKVIRTKLKFSMSIAKTLNIWALNQSGATLTTGAVLEVQGVIYGRWM